MLSPNAEVNPLESRIQSAVLLLVASLLVVGIGTVLSASVYVVGRIVVLVWPIWQRMRQTRLRWALTHGQRVASRLLAALLAVPTAIAAFRLGLQGRRISCFWFTDDQLVQAWHR